MKTILKEIITLRKFFVQDLPQGLGPERIMKIVDLSNLVDQHFKSLAANEKKILHDLGDKATNDSFSNAMETIWAKEVELPEIQPFSLGEIGNMRLSGIDIKNLIDLGVIKK